MKYYELWNKSFDIGSGSHDELITKSRNKEQIEELKNKLKKKYGYDTKHGDYNDFIVEEIDTSKISTSLTKEEISSILNRCY